MFIFMFMFIFMSRALRLAMFLLLPAAAVVRRPAVAALSGDKARC
jgi:hypothetical protein